MYFQAAILAALSAGALADNVNLYLTAFAAADNTCAGTAAGNNVTVPIDPTAIPVINGTRFVDASPCITYAPDHGQHIQLDFPNTTEYDYRIRTYFETNCTGGGFVLELRNLSDHCWPMSMTHDWKSVKVTNAGIPKGEL